MVDEPREAEIAELGYVDRELVVRDHTRRQVTFEVAPDHLLKQVEKELLQVRRWQTFGEWPQSHSLRMDDKTARVYVVYSGGETSFSPEGYHRAGSRAYEEAKYFLRQVVRGEIEPAVLLPQGILRKVELPPVPQKWGEQYAYVKALRFLGRKTPKVQRHDDPNARLSWTAVHWLGIRLALALGWVPNPPKSENHFWAE